LQGIKRDYAGPDWDGGTFGKRQGGGKDQSADAKPQIREGQKNTGTKTGGEVLSKTWKGE